VAFVRARFLSPPGGAGVYFDSNSNLASSANRHFAFRGCSFPAGVGKLKQRPGSALDAETMELGGLTIEVGAEPLRVGPGHLTLAKALRTAAPGDRVLLVGGIAEAGLQVKNIKDLTIEAEPGHTVLWKLPPKAGPKTRLLIAENAEGLLLKNITLSGEKRAEVLLGLSGKCPGARFEDVELKDYRSYGVHVTSCQGRKDSPVTFLRTRFAAEGGAGVYFDSKSNQAASANRHFAFLECVFTGKGSRLKQRPGSALDLKTMELGSWRIDR
jgi:hypothetical protein